MDPGWVTAAEDLAQAAVMLYRTAVWRNLNVAVQKEKLKEMFGTRPVSFMCEGQLCSCKERCLQTHRMCEFLSLLWVRSQQLPSLNVCGEFNLRRVCSFAFAAEGGK